MILRDAAGNELKDGDPVSFAIDFGKNFSGQIARTSVGLGASNTAQSLPSVTVLFQLDLAAAPNGVVPGIFKIAQSSPAVDLT